MARPEITGRRIGRAALTIDEFCYSHGISRATYYNMRKRGEGPDETRACGRILITEESARRWRKRATAAPVRRVDAHLQQQVT